MMIVCDGRRMGKDARARLMDVAEQTPLHQLMISLGYRLQPLRAPRDRINGDVVIRLTWSKSEANAVMTVRSTIRLVAPK